MFGNFLMTKTWQVWIVSPNADVASNHTVNCQLYSIASVSNNTLSSLLLEKPDKSMKEEEAAQSSTVEQKPQQSSQPEEKQEAAAVEPPKGTKKDSRRCVWFKNNYSW